MAARKKVSGAEGPKRSNPVKRLATSTSPKPRPRLVGKTAKTKRQARNFLSRVEAEFKAKQPGASARTQSAAARSRRKKK